MKKYILEAAWKLFVNLCDQHGSTVVEAMQMARVVGNAYGIPDDEVRGHIHANIDNANYDYQTA